MSTPVLDVDRKSSTLNWVVLSCLGIGFILLSRFVLGGPGEMTVAKLINQFEGRAHYWNEAGKPAGLLDELLVRSFQPTSEIAAASSSETLSGVGYSQQSSTDAYSANVPCRPSSPWLVPHTRSPGR